jgi:8-oxo-dGTP pyrophosphatase MutT (NUDIX family)
MSDLYANPWKKLGSEIVYRNKWYAVRRDEVITPDGKPGEYNVVDQTDAVFVVPVDTDGNVCLVGMYRYTTDVYSIEVPAGNTDGGEPLSAAQRELQEETGYRADTWKPLGKFQCSNGFLNSYGHVFLATGLTNTKQHEQEAEGIKELRHVPFKKVLAMIHAGEITDCQSIAAIQFAAFELGYVKG